MTVTKGLPVDQINGRLVREPVPVSDDRTLTLTYDEDAGQVVLEGLPSGPAGEAGLSIAEGIELSFDRVDGRLCQVVIDAGEPGQPSAISEPALAVAVSLFGVKTRAAIQRPSSGAGDPVTITAGPEIITALSRLARLDAAQITSPVADSPLWAVEAVRLARQAGFDARVRAEARRAVRALETADGVSVSVLADAADAVLDLVHVVEPELASRLRSHAGIPRSGGSAAGYRRGRWPTMPDLAAKDIRGDGESGDPQGWLDPSLIPPGIFQHAWWPDHDLTIRTEKNHVIVEAKVASGADSRMLARCRARLVDPASRSVVGIAPFRGLGSERVRAEIQGRVRPGEAWVEVIGDETRPVRGCELHHIRRAIRWADAALRASRQTSGPADARWATLAVSAWARCARDWSAADDLDRAYLAAARQAAICPGVAIPEAPSAWAKELAGRSPLVEEAFLAERASRVPSALRR